MKINELRVLEEEIFIMTLRNKYIGRLSYDIMEEEIDLREQEKKRIDRIEEIKEDVEWESKAAKMLQRLIRFGISKEPVNFFKKSTIFQRDTGILFQNNS